MLNNVARNFIAALNVVKDKGFAPLIVFAHAWHESGGFEKVIGKNNYWGIKTPDNPSKWSGLVAETYTHEFEAVQGDETADQALPRIIRKYGVNNVRIQERRGNNWYCLMPLSFRDWDSVNAALEWYCSLIERLYPEAFANRTAPDKFFAGLVAGKNKYATDPNYVKQLTALYDNLATQVKI
jgi:flagellum-specific peptidoglycan hydrolase FlgJ